MSKAIVGKKKKKTNTSVAVAHEELSQFKVYLRQYFFESTFKLAGFFFFLQYDFSHFFFICMALCMLGVLTNTHKKNGKKPQKKVLVNVATSQVTSLKRSTSCLVVFQ